MKVILKAVLATAEGVFYPDQTYDMDDKKAEELIQKGYAVPLEQKQKQEIETEKIEYETKKANIKNKKAR